MTPSSVYTWLMSGANGSACDGFDAHAVASILAVALIEARQDGASVCERVGLDGVALARLAAELFPHAAGNFARIADETLAPDDEREQLRDLLIANRSGTSALEEPLAAMVAARAMRPDHLWQDLGLRSRRELGWLMSRHFEPVAVKNTSDMKWKKFLYRQLCEAEGFTLCTAPSCAECCDFDACFGAEDGESRMAGVRRAGVRAGLAA